MTKSEFIENSADIWSSYRELYKQFYNLLGEDNKVCQAINCAKLNVAEMECAVEIKLELQDDDLVPREYDQKLRQHEAKTEALSEVFQKLNYVID